MSTINVKPGVQFQPQLYAQPEPKEWLEAVGKQLETMGVSLMIDDAAMGKVTVRNSAELQAAFTALQAASTTAEAKAYISDLFEALDDVVKGDAKTVTGDSFDFSAQSNASKALGLGDGVAGNYAGPDSEFGKAAISKPQRTMVIDANTFQVVAGPLDSINHMSTETLKGAKVAYGRDGEEVEDTRVVTGLTTEQTVQLAINSLDDLQRSKASVGQTVGVVPLDEMTWDSESHALRRANPYVSFSLDSRSLELNPNTGQPRVGVGRDFFFDSFMAKKDLSTGALNKQLQDADLMFRTRIRYGSDKDPFTETRVLVGMKQGTSIDSDGTKHARKIDNRTDSANQKVFDTLTQTAQTGVIDASWGWSGSGQVAPAAEAMYRVALQKGITDDVGGETGVLAMEPGAVARQIRGRYHLNETDQSSLLQAFSEAGEPKIKELAALISAAPDWAASGSSLSKADLLAQANALLDRSAIVSAAAAGIEKIAPGTTVDKKLIDSLWPDQPVTTREQAKLQRAVVDAIRTQFDAFSQNVDDLQRNIGGSTSKSVREAGNATDVRDFLRQKSAVSRFMAGALANPESKVDAAKPETFVAYAKKIIAMTDAKERAKLLQGLSLGLDQLGAMNEDAFTSAVKIDGGLGKKQTYDAYLAAFDAQSTGANKDAFTAELGAYLAAKKSPALSTAANKEKVIGDVRKNLLTAHAEVLHRQVEGAGAWGQGTWFNNYREKMLNINPQGWNFIIGSMDYTEFYDAKTGGALTFPERVSRKPLDPAKMTGAMISNDVQIELQAEEGYTGAIRRAQYSLNGAGAGLAMDYALAKGITSVAAGDAAGFEKWFAEQAALPTDKREAFVNDVNAFAKSKGSPIDMAKVINSLAEQEKSIGVLAGFAKVSNPTLNSGDRKALEEWYRTQASLPEEKLNDFLTQVAQYAAAQKSEIPLSPNLLRTLDFKPFAGTNVGQDVTKHAVLVEDYNVSNEVWSMVKQSQRDLSNARGGDVQRVLKLNNIKGAKWEPPTKAKGDYAIDLALP